MLELPLDLETRLREKAAQNGREVVDYLRQIVDGPISAANGIETDLVPASHREADPGYLLSLPLEERNRILEAQAEKMAPLYEADLALPVDQRELIAWL